MELISLAPWQLALASSGVLLLALVSLKNRLGFESSLLVAAIRAFVQLLLIGSVLHLVFAQRDFWVVMVIALVMFAVAVREINARQTLRLDLRSRVYITSITLAASTFLITVLLLVFIIQADPWYSPQYVIPILGMILGNSINVVSLAQDRLTQSIKQQSQIIEQKLLLGQTSKQATQDLYKQACLGALIPVVNSMSAAGLVSLPGMMTGQILAGSDPMEAVKYQLLILMLIAAAAGFGVLITLKLTVLQLFDDRDRLTLQKLREK